MKLTTTTTELRRLIATVWPAVAGYTTLPALRGILIDAQPGAPARWVATNLEVGIETTGGVVVEAGTVAVPAALCRQIVGGLPEAEVTLEGRAGLRAGYLIEGNAGGDQLEIRCGYIHTKLALVPAEEFPNLPEVGENASGFALQQRDLKRLIGQVAFACSDDETRPILTGVHWTTTNETLKLAATNTHRLAIRTTTVEVEAGAPDVGVIIPQSTLQKLSPLLAEDESQVEVFVGSNQVLFDLGATKMVSRLIDGQFPRYARVIPTSHETSIMVQTEDLLEAVKRARPIAKEAGAKDRLILDADGDSLTLRAASDVGSTVDTVQAEIQGPAISLAVNAGYLADILGAIGTEGCEIKCTEPLSPIVLKPVDQEGLYILMPMQVQ